MTIRSIAAQTAFAALSLVAGTTFCAGVASAEEVTVPAPAAVSVAAHASVCAKVELPGSRVARIVCQTREQWIEQQGIDPVAK